MKFSKLNKDLQKAVNNYISNKNLKTPVFVFANKILKDNYLFFKKTLNLTDNDIFYAIKANNHCAVIEKLKNLNSGFEIASLGELNDIKQFNINPDKIICSNSVKIPAHIREKYKYGIRSFAFDTENELIKLKDNAPDSNVLLRISLANTGAEWKLSEKFGAPRNEINSLLKKAISYSLIPVGFTLHFGWNNSNINTWKKNIEIVYHICSECRKKDINIQILNLGGGFPAHLINHFEMLDKITKSVNPILNKFRNELNIRIIAEPGSFLVTNTTVLIAQIFDIVYRRKKKWIFIDSGINQGFHWILSKIRYEIIALNDNSESYQNCIITGPTCDSHDIFMRNCILPANIKTGDYLLIYPAGAYNHSAKNYNGFEYPETIVY